MTRARVLASLAARIGDYREGDIAPIDVDHIEGWVAQFDRPVRLPILTELDHVFARTYITRAALRRFFAEALTDAEMVGDDPCGFWSASRFFNQQRRGGSQAALLDLFDAALQEECGVSVYECGNADGPLIYVDDAVYTGMHVINDLEQVIADAPARTKLYVVIYGVHNQGAAYATRELQRRFRAAGKTVDIKWFGQLALENAVAANSDVLWPKALPDQAEAQEYARSLKHAVVFRRGDGVGKNGFFSSGAGRNLLEQEFLKAGASLRAENQNLKRFARPLGNCVLESLGFGALLAFAGVP